jgi:hypothetical protein
VPQTITDPNWGLPAAAAAPITDPNWGAPAAASHTYLDARLDPRRGRDDAGDLPPDTGTVTRWFETELRPMLSRVAHPETINDLATLLVPEGGALAQGARATAADVERITGNLTRVISKLPAPTGQQLLTVLKTVRHPVREGLKAVADSLIARLEPAVAAEPAVVGRVVGKAPTVNESLIGALNEARQAPAAASQAARLPEYPQAAADTMRSLNERAPVTSARPPPARATATPAPTSATPAPVASHPPAPPLRNLNDAPAVAVTPAQAAAERVLQFNPSKVLAEVKETFTKVGETPLRGEASNAMEFMRRGVPADEAVQRVIARRAPTSAVEDLAARLKQPTDATVKARVEARNASGRWTQ